MVTGGNLKKVREPVNADGEFLINCFSTFNSWDVFWYFIYIKAKVNVLGVIPEAG